MLHGTYQIVIKVYNNIHGQSVITILPNITIVAPEISAYYGACREFKIHFDGDKRLIINQKSQFYSILLFMKHILMKMLIQMCI